MAFLSQTRQLRYNSLVTEPHCQNYHRRAQESQQQLQRLGVISYHREMHTHTHLHLRGNPDADGVLDSKKQHHAGTAGPSDEGEQKHHTHREGATVTTVEGAGTLVRTVGVVNVRVCICGG